MASAADRNRRSTDDQFSRSVKAEVVRKMGRYLNKEEEAELCRQMKEGDASAREKLILSGTGVAVGVGMKFLSWNVFSSDELASMAVEWLVKNVGNYDPQKGRLSTYIYVSVTRYLFNRHRRGNSIIRIPADSGFKEARLRATRVGSIDPEVNPSCLYLADPTLGPPEELERRQALETVKIAVETLSETHRFIIESRFYEGKTLREVGEELGVTFEAVRCNEKRALMKLREKCRSVEP